MVDLEHPENAAILAGVWQVLGRTGPSGAPSTVIRPYTMLGTHPDLVARLWDEITVLLPEDCRWVVRGVPCLVHPATGVIFVLAVGTHTYALRLPVGPREQLDEAARRRAIANADRFALSGQDRDRYLAIHIGRRWEYSGGLVLDLADAGDEWVFGHWLEGEPAWCRQAYEHAGHMRR